MNGVLVIDKPDGLTSHDVVNRVRKILKTKSVGHTGTLDPFATGVLVCLIGRATRLAQFLDKAEKEYLATIQFGFETDTGDRTGLQTADCGLPVGQIAERLTAINIENALSKFRGETWQKPPMYSAKKVAGKKLYELARKNIEIDRQPVQIKISELQITKDFEVKSKIQIRVVCSAGTYIRVLAEDIGKELGTLAHLSELRRTRAGDFDLNQSTTLEKLNELASENQAEQVLISPNSALKNLPVVSLEEKSVLKTINGNKFYLNAPKFADNQIVRMCDERENLIAIGVFNSAENAIQPRVVLSVNEKS